MQTPELGKVFPVHITGTDGERIEKWAIGREIPLSIALQAFDRRDHCFFAIESYDRGKKKVQLTTRENWQRLCEDLKRVETRITNDTKSIVQILDEKSESTSAQNSSPERDTADTPKPADKGNSASLVSIGHVLIQPQTGQLTAAVWLNRRAALLKFKNVSKAADIKIIFTDPSLYDPSQAPYHIRSEVAAALGWSYVHTAGRYPNPPQIIYLPPTTQEDDDGFP